MCFIPPESLNLFSNTNMLFENVIPVGLYCYTVNNDGDIITCCYWKYDNSKPKQENGYCEYLGYGDWECDHLSLLWDKCKECGINIDNE